MPASPWKRSKRAIQRYLLIATGVSSMTLGLALIVSFFAAAAGPSAAGGVDMSQIEGRYTATSLDSTLVAALPKFESLAASLPAAPPAPPLGAVVPPAAPLGAGQIEGVSVTFYDCLQQGFCGAIDAESVRQIPPLIEGVNVTFYDCLQQGFCGAMYNGELVYEGAAACSWDLPIGTRFVIENDPTERIYVCADRGLLAETWVDIFFYSPNGGWAWQEAVGRYATIHILSVPSS